ncbi:MAG: hypothetical protein NC489_08430 [Ruminococcus flavefaciens]|nr:hypothetical protein [Ruminococcus flavefaciens]
MRRRYVRVLDKYPFNVIGACVIKYHAPEMQDRLNEFKARYGDNAKIVLTKNLETWIQTYARADKARDIEIFYDKFKYGMTYTAQSQLRGISVARCRDIVNWYLNKLRIPSSYYLVLNTGTAPDVVLGINGHGDIWGILKNDTRLINALHRAGYLDIKEIYDAGFTAVSQAYGIGAAGQKKLMDVLSSHQYDIQNWLSR